jgi:hypothetical protein
MTPNEALQYVANELPALPAEPPPLSMHPHAIAERRAMEPYIGAYLSTCRTWRYALWRLWGFQSYGNCVMFIGLNPSTADETKDDPTIRRCIRFAKSWGYDGIYMLNLYAFRATDPKAMVHSADPVGPGNDEAFGYYRSRCGLIVAAWGSLETRYRPRVQWQSRITRVAQEAGATLHCLGTTKDGSPRHPLYVSGSTQLVPWTQT